MTKSPIEAQWLEIERQIGDVNDDARRVLRGAFFAGAMAAMHEIADWSPLRPRKLTINTGQLAAVADELALTFNVPDAAAATATTQDLVRH